MAAELTDPRAGPPAAGPPAIRSGTVKGRKKAAVLLISLGSERAADVFRHLRDDEIEGLSLEMAKLQRIDPTVTATVLEELAATVQAYDSLISGGVDYARDVLERLIVLVRLLGVDRELNTRRGRAPGDGSVA